MTARNPGGLPDVLPDHNEPLHFVAITLVNALQWAVSLSLAFAVRAHGGDEGEAAAVITDVVTSSLPPVAVYALLPAAAIVLFFGFSLFYYGISDDAGLFASAVSFASVRFPMVGTYFVAREALDKGRARLVGGGATLVYFWAWMAAAPPSAYVPA